MPNKEKGHFPGDPATLSEVLKRHACEQPNKRAFTFLADGEQESRVLSFAELDRYTTAFAKVLAHELKQQDRAMLLFPDCPEFIVAFLGCLRAGIIPVPAFRPQSRRSFRTKLRAIQKDSQSQALIGRDTDLDGIQTFLSSLDSDRSPKLIGLNLDTLESEPGPWQTPEIQPDDIAFLQYTSGSTGHPKGVMVSHQNMMANERAIQKAFAQHNNSVIVGWLPFHHDMGLIGNILQPLFLGAHAVLMPPMAMLTKPYRWLKAIDHYQGTTSGGPNFAYDLCLRRITPEQAASLDLSSWQVAFNGAEPIKPITLQQFSERFESRGFRAEAFLACYGLAEATLFAAGGSSDHQPEIVAVDAQQLQQDRIRFDSQNDPVELVSSGSVAEDTQVVIADPQTSQPLENGSIGEIWLSGPGIAKGYWQKPDHPDFCGRLAGESETRYLRTGDLGFLNRNQLFVTGRLKELIIVNGKNHYPQDIEQTVQASFEGLIPGGGAVFQSERLDESTLVVVQEVARTALRHLNVEAVCHQIRASISDMHGLNASEVVLIKQAGLPKTTSGKIQRLKCRTLYETDQLPTVGTMAWSTATLSHESAPGLDPESFKHLPKSQALGQITTYLRYLCAQMLAIPAEELGSDRPLGSFGLDSLAAMNLSHRVQQDLAISLELSEVLANNSLEELSQKIHASLQDHQQQPKPENQDLQSPFPLSQNQLGLWHFQQRFPQSNAYNLCLPLEINSALDIEAFAKALTGLGEKYPVLRCRFMETAGTPQHVLDSEPLRLTVEHETGIDDEGLRLKIETIAQKPFDLGNTASAFYLFKVSDQRFVFLSLVHHLVADYWSLLNMLKDLGRFYSDAQKGNPLETEQPVNYAQFVSWQAIQPFESDRAYWRQHLHGASATLNLPQQSNRMTQSSQAGQALLVINPEIHRHLKDLCKLNQATLFELLATSWFALMHRLTQQHDLCMGTPLTGRNQATFSKVGGYFVNPIVVRSQLQPKQSFRELLAQLKQTLLEGYQHGQVPLSLVAQDQEQRLQTDGLYQMLFNYLTPQESGAGQNLSLGLPNQKGLIGPLPVRTLATPALDPMLPLVITATDQADQLTIRIDFDQSCFDTSLVTQWLDNLSYLLKHLSQQLDTPVSHLVFKSGLAISEPSGSLPKTSHAGHLLSGFEGIVSQAGSQAALIQADGKVTSYQELNQTANQIANGLLAKGLQPGDRVGICLPRTSALVAAMLGVLKARGTYVPLDIHYPKARLEHIVHASDAKWVIGQSDTFPLDRSFLDVASLCQQQSRDFSGPAPLPQQAAYIIFTSGSTGVPKGVTISHQAAWTMISWAQETFKEAAQGLVLASTSICFDLSIFELFLPLNSGGRIGLVDHLLQWQEAAFRQEVDLINTVPSVMEALLHSNPNFEQVSVINLAGEPLTSGLVERLSRTTNAKLFNLYGPSEDTTYSTYTQVTSAELPPTIGTPIHGTNAYVLDAGLQPVPDGGIGMLYLAGRGLSQGYLHLPHLTAEVFLPNPFHNHLGESHLAGQRMYRTGDLVRRDSQGRLVYLGRADQQVKIRGFRIELGEIETALCQHPEVSEAAVTSQTDPSGTALLVAFLVLENQAEFDPNALRQSLKAQLPDYCIPQLWRQVCALPLSPNGKLDRTQLPYIKPQTEEASQPLTDPFEQKIAAVWAKALGIDSVGLDDNFYHLGGHSLSAARIVANLHHSLGFTLPLRLLLANPVLKDFVTLAKAHLQQEPRNIASPTTIEHSHALTSAQKRLWFLQSLNPQDTAYHMAVGFKITGQFHTHLLQEALAFAVHRHQALRMAFEKQDGQPMVRFEQAIATMPLRVESMSSHQNTEAASPNSNELLEAFVKEPFDLEKPPLFRVLLLEHGPTQRTLAFCMHHLIGDGWSVEVLLKEVFTRYRHLLTGDDSLPELEPAPAWQTLASWQSQWLLSDQAKASAAYWHTKLTDLPPLLELPTDLPRGPVKQYQGKTIAFEIPSDLAQAMASLASDQGHTPFTIYLTAFKVLLARYCGQTDVVVGTPVSNRSQPLFQSAVGLLANTLALRTKLQPQQSFLSLAKNVRQTVFEALDHEYYPFDQIVEAVQPERQLSHTPLFQVMFLLDEQPISSIEVPDAILEPFQLHNHGSKFDLTLELRPSATALKGQIEYDPSLFQPATMVQMAKHFQHLLAQICKRPMAPIANLSLVKQAPSISTLDNPNTQCQGLYQRFESAAARNPEAIALLTDSQTLQYQDLQQLTQTIANALAAQGVGVGTRVGILLNRDHTLIASLLACLKLGACYVPLDPNYPAARRDYMLRDSQASFVICHSSEIEIPGGCNALLVRDLISAGASLKPIATVASGALPAYLIYTSGSTGKPKGVWIGHQQAGAMLDWATSLFQPQELAVTLASTSICFDLSIFELFLPLSCGATVALIASIDQLSESIAAKVTLINTVPSAMDALLEHPPTMPCLQVVNTAGEPLTRALTNAIYQKTKARKVFNLYGPSEDTTYSTFAFAQPQSSKEPTIGHPISGSQALVLDSFGQHQPNGVQGELVLAGAGIAFGYLQKPSLTAANFLPHPFATKPGERIYATGDQVKRLENGELCFYGRRDQQVKLRGFRIELGEIETLLGQHPDVKQVAVLVQTVGRDPALIVWVSGHQPAALETTKLQQWCRQSLPQHMVPQHVVCLENLPLTPNGKIDKKALHFQPNHRSDTALETELTDPRGIALQHLFGELLGLEQVNPQQSFFDLGGHSLLVMRALSRIEARFGIKLPAQTFFENPSINQLFKHLPEEQGSTKAVGPKKAAVLDAYPLSPTQQLVWTMHEVGQGASYHIVGAYQVSGALQTTALETALEHLSKRHQALQLGFEKRQNQVVQVPGAANPVALEIRQVSGPTQTVIQEIAQAPFDLTCGPLLRAVYLQPQNKPHLLVLCIHHLIADGWSLDILFGELQTLYTQIVDGKPLQLPTSLEVSFTDIVQWQQEQLDSEQWTSQIDYWQHALQDIPARLALPYDLPDAHVDTGKGHTLELSLNPDVLAQAKQIAADHQLTLHMVFLTSWATCLHYLSGDDAFRIGCPIANRNYPQTEPVVGYLANTLIMPCQFEGDPLVSTLFKRMRQATIEAFANRDVPFPVLIPHLQSAGGEARQVFDVAFALWEQPETALQKGKLHLKRIACDTQTSKFDLTLFLEIRNQQLFGYVEYTSKFGQTTIRAIAALFEKTISFLAAHQTRPLSAFFNQHAPPWAAMQRRQNAFALAAGPSDFCLVERIRYWCQHTTRRPALVHALKTVSFAEMNARADTIAKHLLQMGVGPEVGVALFFVRSPEQLIAMLAVLKVGGYFVPLDPQYPERRLEDMLRESRPKVVLSQHSLTSLLPPTQAQLVHLEQLDFEQPVPEVWVPTDAAHPAYMIFTSGSLGKPRSVLVTRAAVNNLARSLDQEVFATSQGPLRVSLNGPLSFDTSLKQWTRLAFGDTLVMIPGELRTEPESFLTYCQNREVQVLDATPSHLNVLISAGLFKKLPHLRLLLIGGEAIPQAMWHRLAQQPNLTSFNMYGPTEVTGDACIQAITAEHPIPVIGRVLPNLAAFNLQPNLWPLDIGMAGQLALYGVGLARGYANNPKQTALRFIPNPFASNQPGSPYGSGSRLYLTGDRVRFDQKGVWHYLGRQDHQVKIRGYRVELGDIEAAIQSHPEVARATVTLQHGPHGSPMLVGYAAPVFKKNPYCNGRERYLLPNGLAVAHLNANETQFLYREMFEVQAYYKHGLSIKDGDTVFDVGSNIGLFTLSTHFRANNLQFFCFEPGPEVHATLCGNIALHDVQAHTFECGLGQTQAEKTYTYYPGFAHLSGLYADQEEELEVVRSFVAQQEGFAEEEHDAAILDELILEKLKRESRTVRIKRFSDIVEDHQINQVDLLKINVEKAEWDVLMGIDAHHWPIIQQIAVEIHDVDNRLQAFVDLLESKDFQVFVEKDWSLHDQTTTNYYLYARRHEARPVPTPKIPREQPILRQADVNAYLALQLPEYMVPQALVMLEKMPLNAHGKIDKSQLPSFQMAMDSQTAPQTPTEEMIQAVWEEVLGIAPIGIHANFFNLGGHSLMAVGVLARIRTLFDCQLDVKTLFEAPTISGLSRAIDLHLLSQQSHTDQTIPSAAESAYYPLSFGQQRLWFLAQMEEQQEGYHVPVALGLKGVLNTTALELAINRLVARHESLRTTFPTDNGQATQVIAEPHHVLVEKHKLQETPLEQALELLAEKAAQPFNLATGPLLRVVLLQQSEQEHLLLLTMHHVITDGWSVGILVKELAALYAEEAHGIPAKLLPPARRYVDYASWERSTLKGTYLQSKLDLWQQLLADSESFLNLPTDRPRPQLQSYRGSSFAFQLSAQQAKQVDTFAKTYQVTPFMVYLSVYAMLLARVSGQQRFNIGTPVANRSRQELENTVGLFLNSLALPIQADATNDYVFFLKGLRNNVLRAFSQAEVPFELVVEALNPARSLSYSPLFQTMFTLQNAPINPIAIPHLELQAIQLPASTAKFDLTMVLYEDKGCMQGLVEFNTDLFDRSTISRWVESYEVLLHEILEQPNRQLSHYPFLTPARRHQLLISWNPTGTDLPSEHTAITRFLHHAAQAGEKPAIEFPDASLSYAELYQLTLSIAENLVTMQVRPGDRIGVYCHRCPEMVAGLLAIQYLGAAYVPLDPTYPQERIAFIVADAQLKGVLTHQGYQRRFTVPTLALESCHLQTPTQAAPPNLATPEGPAYMIYTSGSTGKPKGVVVTHRNVVNFYKAMDQRIGVDQKQSQPVWLALTSISFDISVLELFWTLSRGDTVVLQPDRPIHDATEMEAQQRTLEFGLFYFAADEEKQKAGQKYRLLLEGAAFADANNYSAVWMPERHFHAFGGTFPNPSVAAAAVAATTKNVSIRSGSVVLPLHDPVRVAEEWSMVDNLSNGRVALSIASGWQPNDFVLAPDKFQSRHQIMRESIDTLRKLWSGGTLERLNGVGKPFEFALYPKPVQSELPIWITAAGHPDTFRYAGTIGARILTHLLGQDLDQLSEKIALYRQAWQEAGHEAGKSHVTLMIHTFVHQDPHRVAQAVEQPFKDYLRSSINLVKTMLPDAGLDWDSEESRELLIHQAYLRFSKTHALFGTPSSLKPLITNIKAGGIDELACLIDFGIDEELVLASLPYLTELKQLSNGAADDAPPNLPYAAPADLIKTKAVTHLQCTPSMARIFLEDAQLTSLLPQLQQMLVGGEALPADVAKGLLEAGVQKLYNMYGPTETTIWSSVAEVAGESITIGQPIANTQMFVTDHRLEPQPIGSTGDLWIGGEGVTQGYWQRPSLTASRFIPNPHGAPGSRLYLTGDQAARLANADIRYLGRNDDQVKLQGFRIEMGELEAQLNAIPGVVTSVAVVRTDQHSDGRLIAYVVPQNKLGLARIAPKGFKSEHPQYTLPNGLEVYHHDSRQLGALHQELFADAIYLKHGLSLPQGAIVFDVGANIGGFSMFTHYHSQNAKVFAFEPIPPTYQLLSDNFSFHRIQGKVFNFGLSNVEETATFTYYPHMSGLSSRFGDAEDDKELAQSLIHAQMQQGTLGSGLEQASKEEIETFLSESYRSEMHTCQLKTLSQIIRQEGLERIDFLKIDVEKSECLVLEGIEDQDWSKIHQISMEIDGDHNLGKVKHLLQSKGFKVAVDEFMTGVAEHSGTALKVYMLYASNTAYVMPKTFEPPPVLTKEGLREQLIQKLPEYMVPSDTVFLEALPLTPNGKVDKKQLPSPNLKASAGSADYVAPRNEVESQIETIWKAVLQQERVGINSNFFELGGNSLLLTHVLTQVRATLAPNLSMVALFKYPTIAALASHLSKQPSSQPEAATQQQRAQKRTVDRKRLAQKRGRFARSNK